MLYPKEERIVHYKKTHYHNPSYEQTEKYKQTETAATTTTTTETHEHLFTCRRACNKIQHLFMLKVLTRLGRQGTCMKHNKDNLQ